MLDVHSLTLARADDGSRHPHAAVDGGPWLQGADVVQCNLAEAGVLTGSGTDDPPMAVAGRLRELLRSAGRPCLGLLTLGSEGAILVDVETGPLSLPAPRRVDGDPTGAGDTLGAAFMAGWMAGTPPVAALLAAMQAAATACARSGCDSPGQDANGLDAGD